MTLLRLKFPTYFHFLNTQVKKKKGNERKKRKEKLNLKDLQLTTFLLIKH